MTHRGVRRLCILVALSLALLLFLLANNLPPFAWRMLAGLILLAVIISPACRLVFWLTRRSVHPARAPTHGQRLARTSDTTAHLEALTRSSAGRSGSLFSEPAIASLPHLAPAPTVQLPSTPQPAPRLPTWSLPVTPAEPVARWPAIQLIVSTGLDVGLTRKDRPNEDSLLALQNTHIVHGSRCPIGLFVIADGMGGHGNGQEASRLVIQSLNRTVLPSIISGPGDKDYAELLTKSISQANYEVYQRNCQHKADMGTTIAAALVIGSTAYIANAGDSRIYLYRASSGLLQVTRDHSIVARMVEHGLIQPEEVYTHPQRNEIYRGLGQHPSEEIDMFILALQPEDLLLLCSDGLWEMVRDDQIRQITASTLVRPTHISAELVQAALAGGGKDNISVITVSVKAQEAGFHYNFTRA